MVVTQHQTAHQMCLRISTMCHLRLFMGTVNRYLASNIKFMCPRTQKVQLFTSFRSHMDPHFGTIWLLLGTKWLSRYVFAMSRCVIEFIWGGSINHLITSDIKFTRSRVKRYNYKSIFEVARIVIYGILSIQSGQNGAPLVLHWTALMSSCSAFFKSYLAGPDNYLFIYLASKPSTPHYSWLVN